MKIRTKLIGWMCCALAALALVPCTGQAQPVQENAMKAAYVYNFMLFTEWPAQTLANSEVINICLSAGSGMQEAFQSLSGKVAKGKRINIMTGKLLEKEASGCHVIYVERVDRAKWPTIKKILEKKAILAIVEDEKLLGSGAMIVLALQQNKMVFDIDLSAARQSRLEFSSKLLRLARMVK